MNVIERSITIGSEISGFIREWFITLTHSNASEQISELDEGQKSAHPVWNGDLDEPIWW